MAGAEALLPDGITQSWVYFNSRWISFPICRTNGLIVHYWENYVIEQALHVLSGGKGSGSIFIKQIYNGRVNFFSFVQFQRFTELISISLKESLCNQYLVLKNLSRNLKLPKEWLMIGKKSYIDEDESLLEAFINWELLNVRISSSAINLKRLS